jgi:hypothetical protein
LSRSKSKSPVRMWRLYDVWAARGRDALTRLSTSQTMFSPLFTITGAGLTRSPVRYVARPGSGIYMKPPPHFRFLAGTSQSGIGCPPITIAHASTTTYSSTQTYGPFSVPAYHIMKDTVFCVYCVGVPRPNPVSSVQMAAHSQSQLYLRYSRWTDHLARTRSL